MPHPGHLLHPARHLRHSTPGQRGRFLFSTTRNPALLLASMTKEATRAFRDAVRDVDPEEAVVGAFVVTSGFRYAFFGPMVDKPFVRTLAAWTTTHRSEIPALTALEEAFGVRCPLDIRSDRAIEALEPSRGDVIRAPGAWDALATPQIGDTANLLRHRLVGERLWYWLNSSAPRGAQPLILEPVERDPLCHRLIRSGRRLSSGSGSDYLTGLCLPMLDGRLQFVGDDLTPAVLPVLATWVSGGVVAHPSLSRLRDCELVVTTPGGAVTAVHADPSDWEALPSFDAPATIAEAATTLGALQPEERAWFWLCPSRPDGTPHLMASPLKEDPNGAEFGRRMQHLASCFGNPEDAVWGLAQRLPSGTLLFSTPHAEHDHWSRVVDALVRIHGRTHRTLHQLRAARLVHHDAEGDVLGAIPPTLFIT